MKTPIRFSSTISAVSAEVAKLFAASFAVPLSVTLFASSASAVAQGARPQASSPLFSQGAEIFDVKNEKSQTPVFRVLDKTPAERALAVAVASALNQSPETDPKIPVREYLEVRVDRLKVLPDAKDPSKLGVSAFVSGHELDIPKPIVKADFLAGRPIEMNFPPTEKDVSVFSLKSQAALNLHLDTIKNEIVIENANGQLAFSSPITGDGEEKMRFKGRATRQTR